MVDQHTQRTSSEPTLYSHPHAATLQQLTPLRPHQPMVVTLHSPRRTPGLQPVAGQVPLSGTWRSVPVTASWRADAATVSSKLVLGSCTPYACQPALAHCCAPTHAQE